VRLAAEGYDPWNGKDAHTVVPDHFVSSSAMRVVTGGVYAE
jgi:hypothetical protein